MQNATIQKELIGVCGLYCGACDNYRITQDDSKHLLNTPKYKDLDTKTLECCGCNSDHVSEHCGTCPMRKCASSKGYTYCGECADYPCDKVRDFYKIGFEFPFAKHRQVIYANTHDLHEMGIEKWLNFSVKTWTCTCGQAFTYYETECSHCKTSLENPVNKLGCNCLKIG